MAEKIYGWDTSAKIGWLLVGLSGGLFGLLACFLVNRNTSRFTRTMAWTGIGIVASIALSSLVMIVFGDALVALMLDGYTG